MSPNLSAAYGQTEILRSNVYTRCSVPKHIGTGHLNLEMSCAKIMNEIDKGNNTETFYEKEVQKKTIHHSYLHLRNAVCIKIISNKQSLEMMMHNFT